MEVFEKNFVFGIFGVWIFGLLQWSGRKRGRGNHDNNRDNHGNRDNNDPYQLCGREGHSAYRCYKHFETSFRPPLEQRSALAATTSYGIDTNWYTDTGATDHITGELDKLTVRDKYHDNDQVHTASGAGMRINQIVQSIVKTPKHNLILNNVLYVPEANKNLASVHRLTSDNNVFIEYHPNYFLIKDQVTKDILLRGECKGGLYPLKLPLTSSSSSTNKTTHAAIKPSPSRWHNRLGHPLSHPVLQRTKLGSSYVCLGSPHIQQQNKNIKTMFI
jgi:hypothetical protein